MALDGPVGSRALASPGALVCQRRYDLRICFCARNRTTARLVGFRDQVLDLKAEAWAA